jgi:uncharacterized protein
MYCAKVHKYGGQDILACCDKQLTGERLCGEDFEIHVNPEFYGSEEITVEEFTSLAQESSSLNLLGDSIVSLALEKGIISGEGVIDICGVKHAQVYSLP